METIASTVVIQVGGITDTVRELARIREQFQIIIQNNLFDRTHRVQGTRSKARRFVRVIATEANLKTVVVLPSISHFYLPLYLSRIKQRLARTGR